MERPTWLGAGVDFDELAAVRHTDQLAIGSHLYPRSDQVAGDGVERLCHLDVVVPVHLGSGVDGKVIRKNRAWKKLSLLLEGEQLGRTALGRAVGAHAHPGAAPDLGPALGVANVDEVLTGKNELRTKGTTVRPGACRSVFLLLPGR